MKHDIDGSGERELVCSPYTMMLYEQEFNKSIVADVYGEIDLKGGKTEVVTAEYVADRLTAALDDGKQLPKTTLKLISAAFPVEVVTKLDYTADNWEAYLRAYWAMLKTADEKNGTATASFRTWVACLGPVDMREVSNVVYSCMEDGIFHSRASRLRDAE